MPIKNTTLSDSFIGKPINYLSRQLSPTSVITVIDIDDSSDCPKALASIDDFIRSADGPHAIFVIKY